MNKETKAHPFVSYLENLTEDRAALASLRRGLGRPTATAPDMYRYVIPRLPRDLKPWQEEAYYLVAALFGLHPEASSRGNMGSHFAATLDRANPENNQATERRFTVMLSAHPDDLPFQLRQAVSFLRSQEKAINYHQLIRDVQNWDHPARFVQRNWANAFWGQPSDEGEDTAP